MSICQSTRSMDSRRRALRRLAGAAATALLVSSLGCATVAEMRKLERRVARAEAAGGGAERRAVADAVAEIDALRADVDALRGRLEVAEKTAADALGEARRARQEIARRSVGGGDAAQPEAAAQEPPEQPPLSAELRDYREAYAAWRGDDLDRCIDLFRAFLQTHPSSSYGDDATFWEADCHFKKGDFKQAAIRFDDVVRYFPEGNKAADALYREGEALLRLGYQKAARKAFERVIDEYPDSGRAQEASRQIQVINKG